MQRLDVSGSLVVRPHAKHLYRSFLLKHFVDKPMLNVDAPRVRAREVPHKLFVRGWILERIRFEDREQRLCAVL